LVEPRASLENVNLQSVRDGFGIYLPLQKKCHTVVAAHGKQC